MSRLTGRWFYSKEDRCYYTALFSYDGGVFLRANATAQGGISTVYYPVDESHLNEADAKRLDRMVLKRWRRPFRN
jgi:hypothetical protein